MDPSKPPSDISAPSKANSDIDERPKASSDIGVATSTKLSPIMDLARSESKNKDDELKACNSDVEPRHRSGSMNVKLPNDEPRIVASVEDAPVDARVPQKRGKLIRSYGSIENNAPSYSFVSTNSFEQMFDVEERMNSVKKRRSPFDFEKMKLHSRIEECRRSFSMNRKISGDLGDRCFANWSSRSKTNSLDLGDDCSRSRSKLQKSQSFAYSNVVASRFRNWPRTHSVQEHREISDRKSFDSQTRLVKMQTLVNLDNIEVNVKNVPQCEALEKKLNSKTSRVPNYICQERHQAKSLKHSLSFQNSFKLRETKIVSSFEKPNLSSSRSFCVRNGLSDNGSNRMENREAKLGDVNTTKCYNGSISSSLNADSLKNQMNCCRSNLSPPPLSSLQIFAISTKPLDIPVPTLDPIPNNVDKLPSLPIIQRNECRVESEKKLSILEPPPPGLVSREESTESWNRFLVQLNSILESRAGEFV